MNKKKSDKANLENKKLYFVLLGVVISVSFVILILELGCEKKIVNFSNNVEEIEVELQLLNNNKRLEIKEDIDIEDVVDLKPIITVKDTTKVDTVKLDFSVNNNRIENIEPKLDFEKIVDKIYFFYDKKPEFVGGRDSLLKYIQTNIEYPQVAIDENIQGKIYVRFVITKKGNIEKAKVIRSVHPLLDQEALRIINSLPRWIPAEYDGCKVSVWHSLPINFIIKY